MTVQATVLHNVGVAHLLRDGVALAYDEAGDGDPPLVLVHGAACNRRFWEPQVDAFAATNRVIAVDLRGHGQSDAPAQRYTMRLFSDDLAWTCAQLGVDKPVVVGHSLGGMVALDLAATYPDRVCAAVLIDSLLCAGGDRTEVVRHLVEQLGGSEPGPALRSYFKAFFGPYDDPGLEAWALDQAVLTQAHVTSSLWEESVRSWDDAAALAACRAPLLYIDAGTPNADLARASELCPGLMIARTVGSGHFSPLVVPEQVNAMLERFLRVAVRPGT